MIAGGRQLDDAARREVKKPQVCVREQKSQRTRGLAVTPGFPLSEMNGTSLTDRRVSRIGQL